jgi:hypothetical protein
VKRDRNVADVGGPADEAASARRSRLLAVDYQLVVARRAFGQATAAALAGRIEAPAKIRAAIDAVEQARVELRHIADADEEAGR